jgi:CHASE3 domain sensor protein
MQPATMPNEQQRKANLRLALILATIAVVLGAGFVVRMIWFR